MRRSWKNRREWCWARQLPRRDDRLAAAVECVRQPVFHAQALLSIPETGELVAVEIVEHGKRLQVCGRGGRVTIAAGVFWRLMEAARNADRVPQYGRINGGFSTVWKEKAGRG